MTFICMAIFYFIALSLFVPFVFCITILTGNEKGSRKILFSHIVLVSEESGNCLNWLRMVGTGSRVLFAF